MKIPVYKGGLPAGHKEVPEEISQMAVALSRWMEMNNVVQAHDLVQALQRQLAEVTRERDTLKAMVELHDALNDRRRAIADNERRTIRGR